MSTDEIFINTPELPKKLSKEELHKLIQETNEGSKEAREKLITHNIRLVLYEVSTKFKNVDYDKKELVSIGNMGLLKAINTYDISKGFEFATYATKCIDNEILMFLRKLKKNQNVDSIDRVVFQDKDGSEFKIEDKLSDESDMIENSEKAEMHKIIRKLVTQLPKRDMEIVMLYFGFYNNQIYNQKEIADKLQISQSYVSRLIAKIVKKIGKQLEMQGVIELHEKTKKKGKDKNKMRRLQSIYEYFKDYTREQIDEMISKLSDEEKNLITLRYGEDLANPVQSKLTEEDKNRFYGNLVPKMKKLLRGIKSRNKQIVSEQPTPTEKTISIPSTKESKTQAISAQEEKEDELVSKFEIKKESAPIKEKNDDITRDDCIKMLELLRTPTFSQMMSVLTAKESIIISLKLGYVDGRYFSTESIAHFLNITEDEVRETTKKILLVYKENINNILDNIIDIATEKSDENKTLAIKSVSNN